MIKINIAKTNLSESILGVQKIIGSFKSESETSGMVFHIKKDSFEISGLAECRYIKLPLHTEVLEFQEVEGDERYISTDFRKLHDVISGMRDSSVSLSFEKSSLTIRGKSTKATLPLIEKKLPDVVFDIKSSSVVNPKDLQYVLKNTQFSSSSESSRPVLSSIKAVAQDENSSVFVTTDGFRLSIVRAGVKLPADQKIQIPLNFLRDTLSLVIDENKPVKISFTSDNNCIFEQDKVLLLTKMTSGDFPPYEKVLFPEYSIGFSCSKDDMAEAVKTMSVMSRDHSNIVVIEFSTQRIIVRTKKEVGGENEVVVASISNYGFTENPMIMAFNAKYLLDFLSVVPDDTISMRINRADSPSLLIPGNVERDVPTDSLVYKHVIMPVRISE